MAQASSQWQQLVNSIAELLDSEWSQEFLKQFSRRRWRKQTVPLVALGVAVAMLLWNWKLFLATGAGILVMLAMYLMQQWNWPQIFQQWRQWFNGTNRSVAISVGTGGITSLFTYMAVSIWVASENKWIATGEILQGMGIVAIFIRFLWPILTPQSSQEDIRFNEQIVNLTDSDPLKRLIAVRQLSSFVRNNHCDREQLRAIADYFNLMWSRETEPLVRDALLEGLELLGEAKQLTQGPSPLSIPFRPKRVPTEIPDRTYE